MFPGRVHTDGEEIRDATAVALRRLHGGERPGPRHLRDECLTRTIDHHRSRAVAIQPADLRRIDHLSSREPGAQFVARAAEQGRIEQFPIAAPVLRVEDVGPPRRSAPLDRLPRIFSVTGKPVEELSPAT